MNQEQRRLQESKPNLSRTELPRFGVIHLLALTATTALAALPYQLQLLWIRQSPDLRPTRFVYIN